MIALIGQQVSGGPYAYALELPPGEELHAAFLDWVYNDPIAV